MGLTKTCPLVVGFGLSSHNMRVSLVPRLIHMSVFFKQTPAREAGLSPVNATTSHDLGKPYLCERYLEIFPRCFDDETNSPSFSLRFGAQA